VSSDERRPETARAGFEVGNLTASGLSKHRPSERRDSSAPLKKDHRLDHRRRASRRRV